MSYARCVLVNSLLFIHECVCPTHEATRDDAPTGREGGREEGGFHAVEFHRVRKQALLLFTRYSTVRQAIFENAVGCRIMHCTCW